MALSMLTTPKILAAAGVTSEVQKQFKHTGAKLVPTKEQLKIVLAGESMLSVPLPKTVLDSLVSDALEGDELELTKNSIQAIISAALTELPKPKAEPVPASPSSELLETLLIKEQKKAMENAPSGVPEAHEAATPLQAVAGTFPVDQMETGPVVKLFLADKLYQPVLGTSNGSRYFAVAIGPELKVAARWKGKKMSIRVEGPGVETHQQAIKDAGFTWHSPEYASIHIGVDDKLASRALGALICGLQVPMVTPVPIAAVIKGKGS